MLDQMLDLKSMLNIHSDYYVGMMIGFCYPEIKYKKGT